MEDDSKAKLVEEICFISNLFKSCTHKICCNPHKPVFVDWYLILQIEEDCRIDQISRRYRKLALQLHPDKNKHLSASAAFRLVSEAYKCLIDEETRNAFNAERCNSFCNICLNKASSIKRRQQMPKRHKKSSVHEYPIFKPSGNSDSSFGDLNQIRSMRKRSQVFKRSSRMRQSEYPIFENR